MSCTLCRTCVSCHALFAALLPATFAAASPPATPLATKPATLPAACAVQLGLLCPLYPPLCVHTLSHTPHTQTPTRHTQQVDGSLKAEKGMGISKKDLHSEIERALQPPSASVRQLPPLSSRAIHSEAQLKHDVRLSASVCVCLRLSASVCVCVRLSASVCVCVSLSLAHAR